MPQLIFGGILATILLGFYIWSIVDAVYIAKNCVPGTNCTDQFSANMSFLLNSLGGLISATSRRCSGRDPKRRISGRKSVREKSNRNISDDRRLYALVLSFWSRVVSGSGDRRLRVYFTSRYGRTSERTGKSLARNGSCFRLCVFRN